MAASWTAAIGARRRDAIARALLSWFEVHGRDLDFRRTRDPWAVLVAEVMLQQTRVGRVESAWAAFLGRFPTPAALAAAPPADAIRAWGGLGYNGRVVRLQRAAAVIVERHGGRVPDDVVALEALPGIGPYTGRAVAAIAFGRAVAAVDTNVGRVVRRVFGLEGGSPAVIQRLADGMVYRTRAADWTHAMMDVGAMWCRRREPLCAQCPLQPFCRTGARWAAAGPFGRAAAGPGVSGRAAAGLGRAAEPRARARFPATRRWLRGRIVARLRHERDGRWIRFDGPMGEHAPAQVAEALRGLATDGLVEIDALGRARLPHGP